jgi:uncharacterized membrane protein YGL010W
MDFLRWTNNISRVNEMKEEYHNSFINEAKVMIHITKDRLVSLQMEIFYSSLPFHMGTFAYGIIYFMMVSNCLLDVIVYAAISN